CWNVPAGARDARDLVVEIRVVVDHDGIVQQATIVDQSRLGSDPFFRAAAESARRAFFNPQCRPLPLPAEKYAIWKDLVVVFSPKDILCQDAAASSRVWLLQSSSSCWAPGR